MGAAGWKAMIKGDHLAPFLMLCLGVWLHAADSLLVATLMPDAVAEIGGAAFIGWTIALYQVGSIVAGASNALLVIRHGLRPVMVGAALLFGLGCAVAALTPDMTWMLIGRLAQGLGGGTMVACGFVGVARLFPPEFMSRLMAGMSVVWGVSALLGPVIGGLFASMGMWRMGFWAFALQAVIMAGLALWMLRRLPSARAETVPPFPLRRMGLFVLAVLTIASAGLNANPVLAALMTTGGAALAWLFFRRDSRSGASRLFPRNGMTLGDDVGRGMVMVLSFATATVAFTVYGPVLMRVLYGIGPLEAGYLIALESVAWSVFAVLVALLPRRREPLAIGVGSLCLTLSVVGLAFSVPQGRLDLVMLFLVLAGGGFGMSFAPVLGRVVVAADENDKERASAGLVTLHQVGYAFGAAACGVIANLLGFADGIDPVAAQAVGFWIFFAFLPLALLGNAAVWLLIRKL